jgi:hypothetical protein
MSLVFATLFNSTYLLQGLALVDSLIKKYPESKIYLALLDELTISTFRKKYPNSSRVIYNNVSIKKNYEKRIRNSEKLNEIIFSLKPDLISEAMLNVEGKMYFYCDADLYFFNRFNFENFTEDVFLTEHLFKNDLAGHSVYGKFNGGFVGFSKSLDSLNCLEWWKTRCRESTAHDPLSGIVGDQKYLEYFPNLVPSINIIKTPSMNQSVWMFDDSVSVLDGPRVNGQLVHSYHFHRLKTFKILFKTGINQYGRIKNRPDIYRFVYKPYLVELDKQRGFVEKIDLKTPKFKLHEFKRFEWALV